MAATAGKIVTWIFSGISFTATVTAIFFLGGAWKEFEKLKDTVKVHCEEQKGVVAEMEAKRERLAEKIEVDRKTYSLEQADRDKYQDGNLMAQTEGIASLRTDVAIVKERVQRTAEDVAFIREYVMKHPSP